MKDFIYTITVDVIGEGEGEFVTEKNYKEVIRDLKGSITATEMDNDILDEKVDELVENNDEMSYSEWNKKLDKLGEQRRDNDEYIKKCEKTIEILEKIAELREWE
jgi:hypothetical protein